MSRRFHSKSRSGCSQCKKRRVKCQNQGLRCQNCQRRGEECDLVLQFTSDVPNPPPSRSDLGLLTYFADVASLSVAISPDKTWFWTTELPRQAEKTPFLLHGLSAVSTLHLAERLPDGDSSLSLFRKHYSTAIAQFRLMACQISADNCIPIFALSLIVIVVQLKLSSRHPRHSRLLDASFSPVDCLEAMRGAKRLIQAVGPFLNSTSSVSSLFVWRRHHVDPQVDKMAQLLLLRLCTLDVMVEDLDCCSALHHLRSWAAGLTSWEKSWNELAWWPAAVSSEFLSRLESSDPIPLVLYAFWCCGIHVRFKEWFVDGFAVKAMQHVKTKLDPSWWALYGIDDLVEELDLLVSS
ncbi:hypothetical protein BGZ63DRAFT_426693 [Mariannaea sp. PMI_226]|nr:hypothetical protein BGZ63DRAFT_426693 [Mariannaea sp. PMI_226]